MRIILLCLAAALTAHGQWIPLNPGTNVQRQHDRHLLSLEEGVLRVQGCSDSILRITQSPTSTIPDTPQFVVIKSVWPVAQFDLQQNEKTVTVTTPRMRV